MKPLVLQSDFGTCDGAVCAMYGVANCVCEDLKIYDLTHDVPQYDIWEASYRLIQTIKYWPKGTVFVSVVDPGVGSNRKSVVAKTLDGQYIVTPDNGTLTHIKTRYGISEVRIIDETKNRLEGSADSYTFHGRDVYAYTGARLAAGIINFEDVGPKFDVEDIIELPVIAPTLNDGTITGTIDVLDVKYGSIWTNINKDLFDKLNVNFGETIEVTINHEGRILYDHSLVYSHSFADVKVGECLLYINSLNCVALAINQGNFASAYHIRTGTSWQISLKKE